LIHSNSRGFIFEELADLFGNGFIMFAIYLVAALLTAFIIALFAAVPLVVLHYLVSLAYWVKVVMAILAVVACSFGGIFDSRG